LIYPKGQSADKKESLNLNAKSHEPGKKRETKSRKKFNLFYWVIVLALTSWMLYLNVDVFMEYSEVKEEYNKVEEEYREKKEILNEKVKEYERLKKRIDESRQKKSD